MSQTITLVGAEDVQTAGHNMERAAIEMTRAASHLAESLAEHHRWADDWLLRLAAVLEDDITVRRQS